MATQVDRAISWAYGKIGSYGYNKLCQRFVMSCYAYGAGMPYVSAGTALIAFKKWHVSTSRNNIPRGAAVYFDSPTSPSCGHVGLYVGNDQVIHAFGKVKKMSLQAIINCGCKYKGWGWTGGRKPTGAGSGGGTGGGGSNNTAPQSSASAPPAEPPAPTHIPQVEKVYTKYDSDNTGKMADRYQYVWQASNGTVRDISDRVGSVTLTDDSDSICVSLSFSVLQSSGDRFFRPLGLLCGDYISVVNTGSTECIFWGQIQSIRGSYQSSMSISCLDAGRRLTTNDVILQFNNVSAQDALSGIAAKVGIPTISCPKLISSVYSTEKGDAASIIQHILETVTAENGVVYFPRMMGETLVIRSYAKDCIRAYCRQADNLRCFDVMDEISDPQVSWDIKDLRNKIIVYSESDSTITIQATTKSDSSIRRYGERVALETYSDRDSVSASAKAKTALAQRNRVDEDLSLSAYGSDRVVAGVRLAVKLPELTGEFWVTAVTHHLDIPHRMDLTLRRAN